MPQEFDSLSAGATLSGAHALSAVGDLQKVTDVAGSGTGPNGRPVATSSNLSLDGSNLQSTLNSELPWIINHAVDIDMGGASAGDIRVPPYIATWKPQNPTQNAPITIRNGSMDALTATAGVGVLRCLNCEFTGTTSLHDEGTAVASYSTFWVCLVDCTINASNRAMIVYNGQIQAHNVDVSASGWGVKLKQWGRYWETGPGTSGSASPAYDVDSGFGNMNPPGGSRMSGGINADANSDGGYVLDDTNAALHGPNSIVMADQQTGDLYRLSVDGGSPSASPL